MHDWQHSQLALSPQGTSPGEEVAHGHWKMDFQLAGKSGFWEGLQDYCSASDSEYLEKKIKIKVPFPKWWQLNVKMWEQNYEKLKIFLPPSVCH